MHTLTRPEFDTACQAYVDAHPDGYVSDIKHSPSGWVWKEHPYVPCLGYLERIVCIPRRTARHTTSDTLNESTEMTEEEDNSTVSDYPGDVLTCKQYVVHSATFRVPTFYFTLHDASGSPLLLDQIAETSLFRRHALPSAKGGSFALTLPDSSLSLLSQGDHPTLDIPCWYIHPCRTEEAVGEIIAELGDDGTDPLRWLETWFTVMSNVVDFFAGDKI